MLMSGQACYIEGLGNPALKYFLCSNALHLAQSKGLHRQPDKAWGHSERETIQRNCLWWAIYALEKHLALCGCRPSAIDDDNVSVQIPTTLLDTGIESLSFSIAIRHAKIHSQISRQLLSFKALSMPVDELILAVTNFHGQLRQLLEEMPTKFKIGTLTTPPHSPRLLSHILYLHFSIYGSLMAVHAHFFYPWLTSRFTIQASNATLEDQMTCSSAVVAEAARKIILALRLVNTNVTTPSWLAFYYPVYALINLFIYVLRYPTLPTAAADLGLLDVCAGHFGFIEFLSASAVSISLPREAANVASKVVRAARAKAPETSSVERPDDYDQHSNNMQSHGLDVESLDFEFDSLQNDPTPLEDVRI